MQVFRLSREKYANTLSGAGAAKYGNRWNSKGVEVLYTAESRALAMAEILVHLPMTLIPKEFVMLTIEVPDFIEIEAVSENELPSNWDINPHSSETQRIGDKFISDRFFCLLKVPSAVVPGDFNYLINTHHPDFKAIKIIETKPFLFNNRLFE